MSYLGARNAISLGVSYQATVGGPNLLNKLSPSLLLQFAGATALDPRITFTRSTTATFTGSNGLIQSAAINDPRFDYSPTTLAPLGLLIEEQRTNLVLQSQTFNISAWNKTNSTVTGDTVAAPDGTTTADTLLETTATGAHGILPNPLLSLSANTFTVSCFIKANGRTAATLVLSRNANNVHIAAVFDLSGASVTQTMNSGVGFTYLSSSITESPVGSGWYRCVLTGSVPAASDYLAGIYASNSTTYTPDTIGRNSYAGDITKGLFLWGAQLEAGAFATSYIPTVASQVTRAADVAVMTGTNFSSWYNATEGSFFAEWTLGRDVTSVSIYTAEDGTVNNSIRTRYEAAGTANDSSVTVGGVIQATLAASNQQTFNTTYKNAMAYKVNDFARSASGAAVVTDTSGTIPLVTQFSIGKNATNTEQPNGHIRQIAYYPRRLANAELQGITS